MRTRIALLLLFLVPVVHANGLTPEAALALRAVQEVALSPDGREVVLRIDRPRKTNEGLGGAVSELWKVAADGTGLRPWNPAGVEQRSAQWSPAGDRIAWLGRETLDTPSQIYIAAADGSAATALTRHASGVRSFAWSSDGSKLAFTAVDPMTEAEQRERQAGRDWIIQGAGNKHAQLHVLDVSSGRTEQLTFGDASVVQFAWSPDGTRFAVVLTRSLGEDDRALTGQVHVIAAAGGTLRQVSDGVGVVCCVVWSGDGEWIAWRASTAVHDPYAGSVFAVRSEGGTPRNLTWDFEGSITWLGTLPGASSALVVRTAEWQRVALRQLDVATRKLQPLSEPAEIVGAPSFSRDGRRFAVAASSPAHPAEAFVGTRGKSIKRITHSNPELVATKLGSQEVVRWRSVDGTVIEGVLVKPLDYVAGKRYPTVLHIHGGSESVVSNGWLGSFDVLGQLLAARGYVVLFPNYRGSIGRGVQFVSGNRGDVMGREWEDTESGLDYLISAGITDAARVGIYGFSWGGYAAGWGATYASERFKAAVGGAGIYNWISEAGTNDTRMHEQLAHWDKPLNDHHLLYLQRSPIYHIAKARTPFLMLHGERDPSCPLGQALEFHTALRWQGVPTELVIYPREGHGMAEHEHALDFARRGLEWFDRYLSLAAATQ